MSGEAAWSEFDRSTPEKFWDVATWRDGNWSPGSLDVADRKRIGLAILASLDQPMTLSEAKAELKGVTAERRMREPRPEATPAPDVEGPCAHEGIVKYERARNAELTAEVERLAAKVARVEGVSPFNEDGYCHWCGNGSWKAGHALECEWADALDGAEGGA